MNPNHLIKAHLLRRVSGENMATALDDDVASLLAGLDGPETSQVQHCEKAKKTSHTYEMQHSSNFRLDRRLQKK